MAVVAEGVETAGQLQMRRAAGCPVIRGFGLARPMPLCDMIGWLKAWTLQDPGTVPDCPVAQVSSSTSVTWAQRRDVMRQKKRPASRGPSVASGCSRRRQRFSIST
ncbi:hypothetical protein [Roseovarius sp. D22-M7]|uniref:hypothetical protein n=1 Tax=Roseovarius sp. D22-M7 TaxID=3127116 RepID=UPI003FA72EC2